jgi:hypothetical protein
VRHRASAKDGRPDECDGVGVGARTACGAVQPGETARAPKDGSALVCDSGGPSLCSHRGPNPNKTDADEKSDEKKKGRGGLGNVNRPNRGEDELKIVIVKIAATKEILERDVCPIDRNRCVANPAPDARMYDVVDVAARRSCEPVVACRDDVLSKDQRLPAAKVPSEIDVPTAVA